MNQLRFLKGPRIGQFDYTGRSLHPVARGWPALPSNQPRLPHPLRISEGGTRCSQPLKILTLSLRIRVKQSDREPVRCRPHRFPPSENPQRGAAAFRITSRRKSKGRVGQPAICPCHAERSSEESEAILDAQSKHPYSCAIFVP